MWGYELMQMGEYTVKFSDFSCCLLHSYFCWLLLCVFEQVHVGIAEVGDLISLNITYNSVFWFRCETFTFMLIRIQRVVYSPLNLWKYLFHVAISKILAHLCSRRDCTQPHKTTYNIMTSLRNVGFKITLEISWEGMLIGLKIWVRFVNVVMLYFFLNFSDVASSSSQHSKQNVASIDQKFGENWKL